MKNQRKNNNKKQQRRRNKRTGLTSLMGVTVRKAIRITQLLSSTNTSTSIRLTTSNDDYFLLQNLYTSSDFQNLSTQYQVFKIDGITVTINRIVSEVQLSTIYTGGVSTFYIAFYPTLDNHLSSQAVRETESALRFSPFVQSQKSRRYPIPNLTSYTTVSGQVFATNYSKWTPVAIAQYMGGLFQIANYQNVNASSATAFLQLDFVFNVEFGIPI